MSLTLAAAPPADWKAIIQYPVQLPEYAEASRHLGYRSLFGARHSQAVLVQVRDPLPPLRALFSRAYVYPSGEDAGSLADILRQLKRQRIPFVRIGNTMWGVRHGDALALPGLRVVERYTALLDLTRSETELFQGIDSGHRSSIRKAKREGVEVSESVDPKEAEFYWELSRSTSDRIRRRAPFMEYPSTFFSEIYRHMIPRGYARVFLARLGSEILAGNLFLIFGDTITYFHGASTRDRTHTFRQAPTACLWSAIKVAKAVGLKWFDLGGFTPTTNASDPRSGVYQFKKRWGGTVAKFYNAEVVLSPVIYRLQQRVVAPVWQRFHPILLRFKGAAQ